MGLNIQLFISPPNKGDNNVRDKRSIFIENNSAISIQFSLKYTSFQKYSKYNKIIGGDYNY